MVQKRVHASLIPMGSVQRMQKKGTVKVVILLEHAAAEEIVGRHALPWAATLMPSSVLLPPVKTAAVVSTFERLYETVMKFTLRTQMQTLAVLTTWTS
ncbi:A/G-specific adenine glycosylase [Gossypium arboreum]|uniref:A/G-specific adenine glycosylase n=1 Tax=Gossypium arboreum TaxID=29729 RepID=A0A0B0NLP7_GOSAR|nr:A/G-specific adenine glycosylase [Gossypium arboreum]